MKVENHGITCPELDMNFLNSNCVAQVEVESRKDIQDVWNVWKHLIHWSPLTWKTIIIQAYSKVVSISLSQFKGGKKTDWRWEKGEGFKMAFASNSPSLSFKNLLPGFLPTAANGAHPKIRNRPQEQVTKHYLPWRQIMSEKTRHHNSLKLCFKPSFLSFFVTSPD